MEIIEEILPDVFLLSLKKSTDSRGDFLKVYNFQDLENLHLNFIPKESYISTSSLDVLRGMHYQTGKYAHEKLVCCFQGKVLDVIVDVRPNSSNFNRPQSIILSEEKNEALLIGKGYAHGFLSLQEKTIMIYMTSTIYAPEFDCGVLWSSINYNWPSVKPIISSRDTLHPRIGEHECEFS